MTVRMLDVVQRKNILIVQVHCAQADDAVGTPCSGNQHAAVDGNGQDIAIVIVGMLADEVDAPGRTNDQLGRIAVLSLELGLKSRNPFRQWHFDNHTGSLLYRRISGR